MKRFIIAISALLLAAGIAKAQEQLENMNFDSWCKKGAEWVPSRTVESRIWGTANKGLSLLGKNGATPDEEFVAVKGVGKKACKIRSQNVLWAFAAGAIYTGSWVKLIGTKGAEITWGVPFTSRPKSLSGYYCYKPQIINYARKPYLHRKGKLDRGYILVVLTDWPGPYHINTVTETFMDDNDPHIIGLGRIRLTKETDGYVRFNLPIEYRDDRTPKYVVIASTPSDGGDFFTGGDESTLWLDEFKFVY